MLPTGALDAAWVAADHAVVGGRGQDYLEQPVCLRDGHRADVGVEQLLAPAPDVPGLDVGDGHLAEAWCQVFVQEVAVQLDCLGTQARPFPIQVAA
jgi:hypothetical protein